MLARFKQNIDIILFTGIRVHSATIAYSRDTAERVSSRVGYQYDRQLHHILD